MAQVNDEEDSKMNSEAAVLSSAVLGTDQQIVTPLRVLCFDTNTTCARLFSKPFSNHFKLGRIDHPYAIAATLGPERIHTKVGNEQTQRLWETRVAAAPDRFRGTTYGHATNTLLKDADRLEQKGRILFVTEYAPFVMKHEVMLAALGSQETPATDSLNPTILPEALLHIFTPIIFIQHPAVSKLMGKRVTGNTWSSRAVSLYLTLPASLRLAKAVSCPEYNPYEYGSYSIDDEDFTIWTSLRWSRILFDYLRRSPRSRVDSAHSMQSTKFAPGVVATRPYVLDAADVANHPTATLATICRLLGIDLSTATSSWTDYFGMATEALKKAVPDSLMRIFNSNVLSGATENIEIEHETIAWKVEFGDTLADLLRKKVDDEMQHYEYLKNFEIRVAPSRTMTGFMQSITGVPSRRKSVESSTAEKAVMSPLKVIRSAIDGKPRERHFSL